MNTTSTTVLIDTKPQTVYSKMGLGLVKLAPILRNGEGRITVFKQPTRTAACYVQRAVRSSSGRVSADLITHEYLGSSAIPLSVGSEPNSLYILAKPAAALKLHRLEEGRRDTPCGGVQC